jgi:hypothetical protein
MLILNDVQLPNWCSDGVRLHDKRKCMEEVIGEFASLSRAMLTYGKMQNWY